MSLRCSVHGFDKERQIDLCQLGKHRLTVQLACNYVPLQCVAQEMSALAQKRCSCLQTPLRRSLCPFECTSMVCLSSNSNTKYGKFLYHILHFFLIPVYQKNIYLTTTLLWWIQYAIVCLSQPF